MIFLLDCLIFIASFKSRFKALI